MNWDPPETWTKMGNFLTHLADKFQELPKAIVIVSAHWEEEQIGITSQKVPSLIYDYEGFPPETYQLTYPVPGDPALAERIQAYLLTAGIPSNLRSDRGLDHGVFIPLKLIYPSAHIPVVQLSLHHSLDPQFHIELGRALKLLADEEVLIIGSGMSYHNLRSFFQPSVEEQHMAHEFDQWLTESLTKTHHREQRLINWREAPYALKAHPRPEHLLPLMVIVGYANLWECKALYHEQVMGYPISGYGFYSTKNSVT